MKNYLLFLLIPFSFLLVSCAPTPKDIENWKQRQADKLEYQNQKQEWDHDNYKWSNLTGKTIQSVSSYDSGNDILIYFTDGTKVKIHSYKYDMKISN